MKQRLLPVLIVILGFVQSASSQTPRRFNTNILPPPEGMYVTPQQFHQAYANGIIISNVTHWRFTGGEPPPPPNSPPQSHGFSSTVSMRVSVPGGQGFQQVSAPALVQVIVRPSVLATGAAPSGVTANYDTEMVRLDISGGGLPPNVRIRESPTRPSLGKTSVEQTSDGGYMIGSFFDIWTEVSTDGGQNWVPAQQPGRVDLAGDPTAVPPIPAPTTLLPPPNDVYITPQQFHALYAQGIIIRDVRHHFFTRSQPPPPPGGATSHSFGSQVDMMVSMDGGQSYRPMRAPASVAVLVRHSSSADATQFYETEMLSLNLQGGDLPPGIMIRESPARRSEGGTAITPMPDGRQHISSFFDIWTELTVDGGQTWGPADGATRVQLICNAPEVPEPSPNLPPPTDEYVSPAEFHAAYAQGIIIKDVRHNRFTQSMPPPPLGQTQIHEFTSQVEFMVSQDGGETFSPGSAPALCVARVTSVQDQGNTRYFETEMLQLDIGGGGLPPGVRVRESPTKASLGRTSVRTTTGSPTPHQISSFFDIFTELTIDGGNTWGPSLTGPVEVVLVPRSCARLTCPSNIVVMATSPSGAVVNYPPPVLESTCPTTPHVFCSPPSGSTFPIGTTTVICRAEVAPGAAVATCTFTVIVRPRAVEIDRFENTSALVGLRMPDGSLMNVILNGPATVEVDLTSIGDRELNGREEVSTELVTMTLSGSGVTLVAGSAHGLPPSLGTIEETQNRQAGRLDLPGPDAPFCTPPTPPDCTGTTADSFFDVFFEVTLPDGAKMHNREPLRVESKITEKPPRTTYRHVITQPIELYGPNGTPTGVFLVTANHDTRPKEIDRFQNTSALVGLRMPDGSLMNVILNGPATVAVALDSLGDAQPNGREEVSTELVTMNLTGSGVTLVAGSVHGLPPSVGAIEESANIQAGRLDLPGPDAPFCTPPTPANCAGTSADSFFDVFFEVTLPDGTRLYNRVPLRVEAKITEKPPRANYRHVITQPIELYDASGKPTGVFLVTANHDTRPKEIDRFPHTSALVGLRMPDGSLVNVILGGPATVAVALDSLQDTPSNGLEEVTTELVAMNLAGSGFQLIAGSANGLPPSMGEIEELQNRQVNRLDLPGPDAPFCTPPVPANCLGTQARSHFDVLFVVITPGGQRLHNRVPLRVEAIITEKPPRANYRHIITQPIELYDDNERPTGVFLVTANHDTRPKEIDHFQNTSALVGLRMPDGSLMNVILNGPATVAVALDSLNDGEPDGLEQVDTELVSMQLSGSGVTLKAGSAHGLPPSTGEIEENANIQVNRLDLPGPDAPFCTPPTPANCVGTTADSFFDVFFEVTLPDGTRLYNRVPLRVEAKITEKPPRANYRHVITQPIELYDAAGRPTGVFLVTANHDTRPKEIDRFPHTSALVGLRMPDGTLRNVILGGPATVVVDLDSLGDGQPNGREEVTTELVSMTLTGGGGMTLKAGSMHGLPPSVGAIEESANIQPNRLDLPGPDAPFCTPPTPANCVGTTADSFFDVFFEVTLPDGTRLYNRVPLRVEAKITEKPPRANYRHVITQPIELYDAAGRPTGVFLVTANHDTRPKEIDYFQNSSALVGLRMQDGSLVNVILNGPATVAVALDSLQDAPANGLEEVTTELVSMTLAGSGFQLIAGSANGLPASTGEIEETQNRQAGRLDLPGPDAPFCTPPVPANCAGTTALSFFDVFFEVITPGGQRLHNRVPLRVEAIITEKPPRANYRHVITQPIELFDENNRPTGVFLVSANHDTRPKEIDRFENTGALVGLRMPDGSLRNVVLYGPTTVAVALDSLADSEPDGLEQVTTELLAMNLSGGGVTLVAGSANGLPPSMGQIEENQNRQAGRLDLPGPDAPFCTPPVPANCLGTTASSFFDVFFEVTLPNGARLHNRSPLRVEATITEKPPRANYRHVITQPIELYDENNQPTGVFLVTANHDTRGPEIDHFDVTTAQITLCRPDGTEVEEVTLTGPSTVHVFVGMQGQADDSDGDGLDDADTEMVQMDMTGSSSMGPVTMRLRPVTKHPFQQSGGVIEENANVQAGRLDVPPFGPAGTTATSDFEVYVEITIQTPNGPIVLHNDRPKRMRAIIDHKPPRPGTIYEFPEIIPLLTENEQPSGFTICRSRHIIGCRLDIACPQNITTCNDPGECGAKVNYPAPVVQASCPPVTVVCVPASGSFFNVGTTTVTCTARDARGNEDRCTFDVTVRDCEPPRLVCPSDIVRSNDVDRCGAIVSYPAPSASDNCPGAIAVSCTPASGTFFPVGSSTVTCTAIDNAGNTNRCTFTITVRDAQPPRIVCPPNGITVPNDPNACRALVTYPLPQATDNCPNVTVACVPPSGSGFPVGTTPVTCTATDAAGNTSTCTFPVIVRDTEPPRITCPDDITVRTCERREVVNYAPNATDNCSATVVCNPPSGTAFPPGSHLVTCIATDPSGNTASCSFKVTVVAAPRPKLEITLLPNGRVRICWESECPNWRLQCTRQLNEPVMWQFVTEPVTTTGTRHCVIVPAQGLHRFYRLWRAEANDTYAESDLLPPQGVYLSPHDLATAFVQGDPDRPLLARWFQVAIPPDIPRRPPPCLTCPPDLHEFRAEMEFQVSNDGGQTWLDVSGQADIAVLVKPGGGGGGFDTELLRLEMQGQVAGQAFRIRESPTRPSLGKYYRDPDSDDDGYAIDSFFDVFTELSIDGGQTWIPGAAPVPMDLNPAPPEQFTERATFPPAGAYSGPAGQLTVYENGVMARWFVDVIPPNACPQCPPPPCLSCPDARYSFDTDMYMQYSTDGGQTWKGANTKAHNEIVVESKSKGRFGAEIVGLDVSGGSLPAEIRLRESPTRRSTGGTSLRQVSGGYRIGSFFDVFTEISTDGGQSWSPARKPSHVILHAKPPPVAERTDDMPPEGSYDSPSEQVIRYGNILARRFRHPITVPPTVPKPPPCLTCPPETYELQSDMTFEVSVNGGQTWQQVRGPAIGNAGMVICWIASGSPVYGNELTRLEASGQVPGLPAFRLRESPTRRSRGLTQVSTSPNLSRPYDVSSFFDVFTELSLDGGNTWMPGDEAAHMVLRPLP